MASNKCECDKIIWNFVTYNHVYKDTGKEVDNSKPGVPDCQSKVSDGYWTLEELEERCKFSEKHEKEIADNYFKSGLTRLTGDTRRSN